METVRCLHTKLEHLWADLVFELQFRLLVMNVVRSFQSMDPDSAVSFHGIKCNCLLTDRELDQLGLRGRLERASFVPGGTPYTAS